MNFNIIESSSVDHYEEMKKDYINGIIGEELRNKWDIGTTSYLNFLKRLKGDGVKISKGGAKRKITHLPPHVYQRENKSFFIQKYINGRGSCYYGTYYTIEEAEAKVNELQDNGWKQ